MLDGSSSLAVRLVCLGLGHTALNIGDEDELVCLVSSEIFSCPVSRDSKGNFF